MSHAEQRIVVGEFGLEARYASGEHAAVVIAPPHPEYGGRLDNPVIEALQAGLASAGVATLRFSFRGTGASGGSPSGSPAAADADYSAALAELRARHSGPYLAAGYSFGAAAALRAGAAGEPYARVLLVAPPLPMIAKQALSACALPLDVLIGDDDMFTPTTELRALLAGAPRAVLGVLPGIDHFFASGGLDEVTDWAATVATAALNPRDRE